MLEKIFLLGARQVLQAFRFNAFIWFLVFCSWSRVQANETSCAFALIVDGFYETGSRIAATARDMQIVPIPVFSSSKFPANAEPTFRPADYVVEGRAQVAPVIHDGDLSRTAAEINQRMRELVHPSETPQVVASPAGIDIAVPIADSLAHVFGIEGNNPATSAQRFNKAVMGFVMALNEVAVPLEKSVSSEAQGVEWAAQLDQWPLFVKPAASSGSDGTKIVYNAEQLSAHLHFLFTVPNQMNRMNEHVLIQLYKRGPQYAVNGISYRLRQGDSWLQKRIVTDIWFQYRDESEDADFPSFVYDTNYLLPYEGATQSLAVRFNDKCLTAQGNEVGAFHNEMKILSPNVDEEEAVLIDPNARPAGGEMVIYAGMATGRNALQMTILSQADPQALEKFASGYELKKQVVVVYLRAYGDSALSPMANNTLAEFAAHLASEGVQMKYKLFISEPFTPLVKTYDSDSMLGKVILSTDDMNYPIQDVVNKLRAIEKARILEIPR